MLLSKQFALVMTITKIAMKLYDSLIIKLLPLLSELKVELTDREKEHDISV